MTMRLLEEDAAVLSVPPLFDERTGRDVLAAVLVDRAAAGRSDDDPLRTLRLAGVLEEWDGLLRVSEPLRTDLRARLATEEPELFRAAAGRFAEHAANGFGDRCAAALGPRPAAVSAAVLRVLAADPDRPEPLDDLVGLIASAPGGRRGDGRAAARQLSGLPDEGRRVGRAVAFLLGLDAWRAGDRATATGLFTDVVAAPVWDRSAAIAKHLLGVQAAAAGDTAGAIEHLTSSVALLRAIGDRSGLAQTLTTLGRVQRLRASDPSVAAVAEDEDLLLRAVKALDEAARVANELGEYELEGRALFQLARVEQEYGSVDAAIEIAQQALGLLRRPDDVIEVQVLLAGLFRDAGLDEEAGNALGAAAELAVRTGRTDRALGRVLNVQASVDRRAGRIEAAIDRARQSVEVGRILGDRRHSAHAKHTLAAALLDRGLPRDHEAARTLIAEAMETLQDLTDPRGVEMVARTATRLRRA